MTDNSNYQPITAPKKDIHLPDGQELTTVSENEKSETQDQEKNTNNQEEDQQENNNNNEEEDNPSEQEAHLSNHEEEEEEHQDTNEDNQTQNSQKFEVTEPASNHSRPIQSARASYSHRISSRTPRKPTDSELSRANQLGSQLVLGNEIDEKDPYVLALTIRNLNERLEVLRDGGSYEDSYKCSRALEQAHQQHKKLIMEMARDDSVNWVNIKQQQAKDDIEMWKSMRHRMEGTLNRKSKNAIEELKRKHAEEKKQFEEQWASESKMKYFSKASDQLRQLRHLQMRLLTDRQFDDSERVKSIAKKLEQDEISSNMVAWGQAKREAFLLLENRQRKQMETLQKALNVKKDGFTAQRMREERVLNNRVRALGLQEKDASHPEHNWVRHHRYEGDVAFSHIGYQSKVRVDLVNEKRSMHNLALPKPPKNQGKGPWRPVPITRRPKSCKRQNSP